MKNTDANEITDDHNRTRHDKHKYNFVDIPWDDRSKGSKIGIVSFLLGILIATIVGVVINVYLFYRSPVNDLHQTDCRIEKAEEYQYVVRIHSLETKKLLCFGAVLSDTAVLANEICVKSGPTFIRSGSLTDPNCKQRFQVDHNIIIPHEGLITKKLVILFTSHSMAHCTSKIHIGTAKATASTATSIGKTKHGGRFLTMQHVEIIPADSANCTAQVELKNVICGKKLSSCPVLAGDLLFQRGALIGLASISPKMPSDVVYFADLKQVQDEIDDVLGPVK